MQDQTTTEKSDVDSRFPPPAATPGKKARPLNSQWTRARYRRQALRPIATMPAPRRPFGPSAKPPSNANSEWCVLAPHSLPPKPGNTRCPSPEKLIAARSDAKFANTLSAIRPADFHRTAARYEKYPPPILDPASPACSRFRPE